MISKERHLWLWALTTIVSGATACVPFRNEGFEKIGGTDEFYSDGKAVTPGNSVDPDADPADVGSPPGWGNQCGKVTIGSNPLDGGALWRHRFSPGSTNGFYTSLETVIDFANLNDGEVVSIAVVKPEGGPEDPVAAWALHLVRAGGDTFFLWSVGNFDRWFRYPAAGSIELGRRYVHIMTYDLLRDFFSWTVDSNVVALDAIPPTYFQNIGTIVLGSSESSNGRNTTYYVDNHWFGEAAESEAFWH